MNDIDEIKMLLYMDKTPHDENNVCVDDSSVSYFLRT